MSNNPSTNYKLTEIGLLPDDWGVKRVGELFVESNRRKGHDDYPILSVTKDGIVLQSEHFNRRIASKDDKQYKVVDRGHLVVSSLNLHLGGIDVQTLVNAGVVSPAYFVFKKASDDLDLSFAKYVVRSEKYIKICESVTQVGASVVRRSTSKEGFKNLGFPVPDIREQRKIVSILSSVDEVITKTIAIIEQTERVKKGLMQQLLTKGIGHTKFKNTVLGMTPEGWEVAALKSIARKVTDGTHQSPKFTEEGIPFLLVSNIVKGFINWETEKFISNETYLELTKNRQVEKGDILYSAVGSYGVAVVVDIEREFSFQRHIAWVKPLVEKVDSHYLAYVLNSGIGKKQADSVAVGNAQKTITLDSLSKFLIPLPSLTEQKEIVDVLWSFDKKLRIENRKLLSLKMIKQGLMQSLLTGKVRVKVDKNEVGQV